MEKHFKKHIDEINKFIELNDIFEVLLAEKEHEKLKKINKYRDEKITLIELFQNLQLNDSFSD
jgi:hypothetical protein